MMDAARAAAQSEPAKNPNFRRRWTDPPDAWKRERRPVATRAALEHKSNFSKHENNHPSRVGQAQRASA
jgi:hypothetical protein